jgi:hypothetical protein
LTCGKGVAVKSIHGCKDIIYIYIYYIYIIYNIYIYNI